MARALLDGRAMHVLVLLLIAAPLRPLPDYERALCERYDRLQLDLASMRARLRHRHWLPVLRVQAGASAWDRLTVETQDVGIDLRRQGYTVSAALEFRFSEIVLDDQELALERERLQTERRRDELLEKLYERWFEARAAQQKLLDERATERDRLRAEETLRLVEAIAFGLARERSER